MNAYLGECPRGLSALDAAAVFLDDLVGADVVLGGEGVGVLELVNHGEVGADLEDVAGDDMFSWS